MALELAEGACEVAAAGGDGTFLGSEDSVVVVLDGKDDSMTVVVDTHSESLMHDEVMSSGETIRSVEVGMTMTLGPAGSATEG